MRPGQAGERAGRSPVSQAAAQPRDSQPTASHHLGPPQRYCTPCATVGVSCTSWHPVQSGTQPSCQPGREHHVPNPFPPNSAGPGKSRAPPPNSLPCCSSQLFPVSWSLGPGPSGSGSWSWSGSWSFSSHVSPPVFPLHHHLFNRFASPPLPTSLSCVPLFSSLPPPSNSFEDLSPSPFQTNSHLLPFPCYSHSCLEHTLHLIFSPPRTSSHDVFKKRPRLWHAVECFEPPE